MVSFTKTAALALAVFAATTSAAKAPKCTEKQWDQLLAATPDTKACLNFYTEDPVPMPADEDALCKSATCLASIKRMAKDMPDCIDDDGDNVKQYFEDEFQYCEDLKTSAPKTSPSPTSAKPKTPKPSTTKAKTPKPTNSTSSSDSVTTVTTAPAKTPEMTSESKTTAPAATTTTAPATPPPTPTTSAAFAPVKASAALLGLSLITIVYLAAN